MTEELISHVDKNGVEIGAISRTACHSGIAKPLHAVVHLHIVRGSEILLQKRAATKLIQPGKWDTCVGGHVAAGEPVDVALAREASEELGICVDNATEICDYTFESAVEREFIHVFIMYVDNDFTLSVRNTEVDEVRFFRLADMADYKAIVTPNFYTEFINVVKPAIDNVDE